MLQTDLWALARLLYGHLTVNQLSRHFHQPICDFLQTTPHEENLFLLARGHFKSTLITVCDTIQRMLADPTHPVCQRRWKGRVCGPDTRILLASNKGENAEDFLTSIKGHLEGNAILLQLFPDILVADPARHAREWTKTAITVKRTRRDLKESTIQTIGVTGELTSKHYDHGVFDDIVGRENSQTKDEREKVWDFLIKARPLFDPGSTKHYVGTHWHYDDVWARLRAQAERKEIQLGTYIMPAWAPCAPGTPEGGDVAGHGWVAPVFPERFCLERRDARDQRLALLPERRREPANFAAQYLLDPVSADTAHFPRVDEKGAPNLQLEETHPPYDELSIVMAVDPAQSLHSWADYSAIAVGGFDRRGDLWLLDLWMARRDDRGLVAKIYDLHEKYRDRGATILAYGFEAVGFAKSYRYVFSIEGDRRGYHLSILPLERDTKVTKQVRMGGIQGQWMAKQIHALRTCEALADYIDQADKFRMDKESTHDDLLDAVADLYQLRGRPSAPTDPFADNEIAQRARWEMEMKAKRPELDQMSLRVMWGHEQRKLQAETEREQLAFASVETWGGL